ncbi:MAG: flagellar hook-basal body complex protein, partial [Rhodospirillaceae bacterium]
VADPDVGLGFLDRDLDLAINGDGFFYVSPTFQVSDEIFFTRDGTFEVGLADAQTSQVTADDNSTITINNGYLIDKNGYYVLGYAADANTGLFSTTGTLAPMRIDEWTFVNTNKPTSTASLGLNLPSTNDNVTDHLGTVLAALGGTQNANLETYDIEVVDSNGAKKSAQLNFTKQSDNTWQVSATTDRNSSPQTDTINFAGTAEAGDTYSVTVTIGGTPITINYTSTGAEGGLSGIRDAVVAAVNANATIAASVTASAGNGAGEITLTANAAATSFSSSASATDGTTAQVSTITFTGAVEAGDVYQIVISSTDNNISPQTITYTATGAEASLLVIRDNIISAIRANGPVNGTVTAAAGAAAGDIVLTARTAGKSFTSVPTVPTAGALANTAAVVATTANVTGTADNAVVTSSSTKNQTTAPQTITFNGNGTISGTAPVTLNMALTFADGATSTFTLNLDDMTQFGSGFLPNNYSHNGLASANMTNVSFNENGHVVGHFTDGTERFVYKVPLGIFSNPDQLEMMNGMVFRETPDSGSPTATFADESDRAEFVAYAYEISNVDLSTEFTRMIMVQKAYNSSATVFRTIDEMVQSARDLKA